MTPVAKIIKHSGLSQTDFAKKVGFGKSYISDLKNGNKSPKLSIFIEWCKMFGVEDYNDILK